MSPINAVTIEKLLEAKRLEKEALLAMLPENMHKHIEVIGKEIKAMVFECLQNGYQESSNTQESSKSQETTKQYEAKKVQANRVIKVDIG